MSISLFTENNVSSRSPLNKFNLLKSLNDNVEIGLLLFL